MTLQELITKLRYFLDEMEVDNSHWKDDRLIAFLNSGLGDVATRLPNRLVPDLIECETRDLANGVSKYDVNSDFVNIEYITVENAETANVRMARNIPIDFYNAMADNSLYEPSGDHQYVIIVGGTINLFPTPSQSYEGGLKIYYRRVPVEMAGRADVPEIATVAHEWIIEYAAYLALLEDEDQRANAVYQTYMSKFVTRNKNVT